MNQKPMKVRRKDTGEDLQLPTTKASPVACSVQQAIQRDPMQATPGEVARNTPHPVQRAIDMLINLPDYALVSTPEAELFSEAGHKLQEYHADQVKALGNLNKRNDEAERSYAGFMSRIADLMGVAENMADHELLEVLADRLNPPVPFIDPAEAPTLQADVSEHTPDKQLFKVCSVLAKHFGDDPAVTFENAAGLVGDIIGGYDYAQETAKQQIAEANRLREELQKRGGVTGYYITLDDLRLQVADILGFAPGSTAGPENPMQALSNALQALRDALDKQHATVQQQQRELQEYIDPNALRQLVSDFGGGLVDNPLEALRDVLTNLQAKQLPEGWEAHTQTLVDSNRRYESVLQTITHALSLAR